MIVPYSSHIDRVIGPWTKPSTNRLDYNTIPPYFDERLILQARTAEIASEEERDGVCFAGYSTDMTARGEGSRKVVVPIGRAQEPNAMAGMCVWWVMENGRVLETTRWARANPGRVGFSEAEVATRRVALEPAIG